MQYDDPTLPTYQCALIVLGVDHRADDGPRTYPNWLSTGHPALVLPPTMHPLRQLDAIRASCDQVEKQLLDEVWSTLSAPGPMEPAELTVDEINRLGLHDALPECADCSHLFYPDSSPDLYLCWQCADRRDWEASQQ